MKMLSLVGPELPRGALEFTIEHRMIHGKRRLIAEPSPALAELQYLLIESLEEQVGKVTMSAVGNMLAHGSNRHFFQLDLKDAFPSVATKRLAGVLCHYYRGLEYEDVADFLARYCMVEKKGGLAQGAPASPLLFDLYCRWWLDRPLQALLKKLQEQDFAFIKYSRYVDDLTFSSVEPVGRYVRGQIKKIVRGAGFTVHPNKLTVRERGKELIALTGGTLPPGRQAVLKAEFYTKLEQQLHLLLKKNVVHPSLRGSIAWFLELEKRVQGSQRNRRVRRIAAEVASAMEILANIRLKKKRERERRYRLPKRWLDLLKRQVDLILYAQEHLPYGWAPKARGIKCPCPFCKGRRHTFTASSTLQTFHCFRTQCGEHGDVIRFAMLRHGWDFMTAVINLAERAKLDMPDEYYQRYGKPPPGPAQRELFPPT